MQEPDPIPEPAHELEQEPMPMPLLEPVPVPEPTPMLEQELMLVPSNSDIDNGRRTDSTELVAEDKVIAFPCIKKLPAHPPRPPDISVGGKFIPAMNWCLRKFVKHMPRKWIPCINKVNHSRKPKFKRTLQLMQLVTQRAEHRIHPSGCHPLSGRGTGFAFDTG